MGLVEVSGRARKNRQVRLRLRNRVRSHRELDLHVVIRPEGALERDVGPPDGRGMGRALRRHLHDLAVDELDLLVFADDSRFDHPVVFRPGPAPHLEPFHRTVLAPPIVLNGQGLY